MFKIKERMNGYLIDGGTMFEIQNTVNYFVSKCPFKDYFNGTVVRIMAIVEILQLR